MLGKEREFYVNERSINTVSEILQQPDTWKKTFDLMNSIKKELASFLEKFDKETIIYLSGAGTSEFVGNTIEDYINNNSDLRVRSVSTTNIVLNPTTYFKKDKKTLLVSFGRSGSSPESVASVNLLNQICDDPYHLVLTCNKTGDLSLKSKKNNRYFLINLPDETHDKSFAMTSSYTNMMLATILAFTLDKLDKNEEKINKIITLAKDILNKHYTVLDKLISEFNFKRIIYLGSGELKGMSQESQLKLLELSAGKVTTMFDSPLGFRHGPKSIINAESLTVIYFSNHTYTRKYEIDLLKEMILEKADNKIFLIASKPLDDKIEGVDYTISLDDSDLEDMFLVFPYILVAQILALKKASSLGISSDNPCPSGSVNRVVKGVNIYDFEVK